MLQNWTMARRPLYCIPKLDLTFRKYYACMLSVCVDVHVSAGANAEQQRASGYLEMELWVVLSFQKCVLATALSSLARAASHFFSPWISLLAAVSCHLE